jgi:integrase
MKTGKDGTYYKDAKGKFSWRIKIDGRSVVRKAGTQKELKTRVAEALLDINARGTIMARHDRDMTVAAYLNNWLACYVKPSRALMTYRQYERVVTLYAIPAIGSIKLDRLTSGQCQAMLVGLLNDGKAPQTVNLTRTTIKRAFNVAREQVPPLLISNPMAATEPAKKGQPKKRTMVEDDMKKVFGESLRLKRITRRDGSQAWVYAHHYGPMIAFMLATGVRVSEANALTWADINLDGRPAASINKKLTWIAEGHTVIESTKTDRSNRTAPLAAVAVQAIEAQKVIQAIHSVQSGYVHSDLLFTTEAGTAVKPRNLQRSLSEVLDAVKLNHFGLHDLRRSYATSLAKNNTPPHILQALLGHSSITTTMGHYVTAFMDDMTAAVDAVQFVRLAVDRPMEALPEKV